MKFLAVLFLTVFAVTYVYADSDECTEERAEACIDNLLNSILDDNSEEEVCRELRSSVDCLKDAVDDCLEERDEEVEEGLEELEKLFKDNCKPDDDDSGSDSDDDSEEIEKCFEENQDYIFECIHAGTNEALNVLMEKGDLDENTLTCAMYGMMAGCFVERVGEKCGETAAEMANKELSDLPEEIADACEAAGGIETHAFHLLDTKRRK